ncbi:MAG: DUF4258 domain-containing protein [Methanoregula sp.]|nr:DUF4258 domain-containing protein [Methanoregula sp.]
MTRKFEPGCRRMTYRIHAVRQMFQRHISEQDVRAALTKGEVIEEYADDNPYPSYLVFCIVKSRPLHVVVAYNNVDREAIVITAYEPDPQVWENDFQRRKKP